MKVYINLNTGSGESEITNYIKSTSFQRKQNLHNDLRFTVNALSLEIKNNNSLIIQILNNVDTDIRVTEDDGTAYFKGKVRNNFKTSISTKSPTKLTDLKVEVVDYSYKLDKKISSPALWQNYKVCDTSNTSTSILHQLFILADFSLSDLTLIDVDVTIPYFYLKSDSVINQIISDLTFQYGQVLNCEPDGKFRNYNVIYNNTTTANYFNNTNLFEELPITKGEEKYDSIKVQWSPIELATSQIVFSDVSNANVSDKCNIVLEPEQFYMDSEGDDIFAEFKYNELEIVYVDNTAIDIEKETNVIVNKFNALPKGAELNIENTSTIQTGAITKLDITGDVYYKGAINKEIVSNISDTDKVENIEAGYIYTKEDAQNLANYHAHYYKHSDFVYVALSKTKYSLGDLVLINETTQLNLDTTAFISNITDRANGKYSYTLIPVTDFAVSVVERSIESNQPAPLQKINIEIPESIPDYITLNSGGFQTGGTEETTIPEIPTLSVESTFKGAVISCDIQKNLSNFKQLELQVSENGTVWYSLGNTTDWKGTVNETTNTYFYKYIHYPIPFAGTEAEPIGKSLYYRVRRRTTADVVSNWSSTISTTTKTIETGDIPANTITTNKLETNILNTMVTNVKDTVTIDPNLGFTGTSADEYRKIYLDNDELNVIEVANNKTKSVIQIGGEVNGVKSNYVTAQGLRRTGTAITIPVDADSIVYNFENTLSDESGSYTATSTNPVYSTNYKFGTKAITTDVTGVNEILTLSGINYSIGDSIFISTWFKITEPTIPWMIDIRDTGKAEGFLIMGYSHVDSPGQLWLVPEFSKSEFGFKTTDSGSVKNCKVIPNTWQHLIFHYDANDDKIYFAVDDSTIVLDCSGYTWTGGLTATPELYLNFYNSNYTKDINFTWDNFLISLAPKLTMLDGFNHYQQNTAWDINETVDDIILIPEEGGRALIKGSACITGDTNVEGVFTVNGSSIIPDDLTPTSVVIDGELTLSKDDIVFHDGLGASIQRVGQITFDWTSEGTYNSSGYHGIRSTNISGTYTDDITMNSYGDICFNIDSNGNDTSYFRWYANEVQKAYLTEAGYFYPARCYNAVGNDYQDVIEIDNEVIVEFGYVYVRDEKGITRKSKRYSERGIIGITSDTASVSAGVYDGEADRLPISVGGFVLAHVDKVYKSGTPLTSYRNGNLTKANTLTKLFYSERIIATFYKEMNQKLWNEVEVNSRHLVRVK